MNRAYEYRHVVTFAETNFLGNVYFAHAFRWQGECREAFLRDHVPGILEDIRNGLRLVTVQAACDYVRELFAFDEVLVEMRLARPISQNRIALAFEYQRLSNGDRVLALRGTQEVACMNANGVVHVPPRLRDALTQFASS